LENTEVPFIRAEQFASTSHHVTSFLQHKDVEEVKREHNFAKHDQALKLIEPPDEPQSPVQPKDEPSTPSHSTQLEIEEVRRPSVSPVLPDIHRFSEFGVELPWLRSEDEELPPLPIPHISGPTFTFTDVDPFAVKLGISSPTLNGDDGVLKDDDENESPGSDWESDLADDERLPKKELQNLARHGGRGNKEPDSRKKKAKRTKLKGKGVDRS
jgi:hypothetical protein